MTLVPYVLYECVRTSMFYNDLPNVLIPEKKMTFLF